GHAWIDARRLAVSLDGQLRLPLAPIRQTEIVVTLRAVRVELNTAAKGLDGVIELLEPIVDGPQVDEGAGPQGIQPGHLPEMMGRTRQITEQETDRRQTIVHIG